MARRLFEHCAVHLSPEDSVDDMHDGFVAELRARLFDGPTENLKYPVASEATMVAFYRWMCATAESHPSRRTALLNVSMLTGDKSHAWLLRAMVDESFFDELPPAFKQLLLERYYRYASKQVVLTEIGRIQQRELNPAAARFVAGILAGPTNLPLASSAPEPSSNLNSPASSASR